VLVGQPQPAHQLVVAQTQLIAGIDLPDLVGPVGPLPRLAFAAGFGRGATGAAQPALDGTWLGQGARREAPRQLHAEQAGAPAGVGLPQGQGQLDVLCGRDWPRPAGAVGRGHDLVAGLAKGAQQVTHGARRQVEAGGQRSGVAAALGSGPDGLADRHQGGSWHWWAPPARIRGQQPSLIARLGSRQNLVSELMA